MSRIIAEGWAGYHKMCVPADAVPEQFNQTRIAFFAGATYLWTLLALMDEPEK